MKRVGFARGEGATGEPYRVVRHARLKASDSEGKTSRQTINRLTSISKP